MQFIATTAGTTTIAMKARAIRMSCIGKILGRRAAAADMGINYRPQKLQSQGTIPDSLCIEVGNIIPASEGNLQSGTDVRRTRAATATRTLMDSNEGDLVGRTGKRTMNSLSGADSGPENFSNGQKPGEERGLLGVVVCFSAFRSYHRRGNKHTDEGQSNN
jgi:hypothetical protein